MLEVQNLSYSTKTFSMENVSFSLDDGYLMTLLGRNGAGKRHFILRVLRSILPVLCFLPLCSTAGNDSSCQQFVFISRKNNLVPYIGQAILSAPDPSA